METSLKITLLQTELFWQQRQANLEHFDHLLQSVHGSDLVVLPEMFTSGFTMQPELVAEQENGDTVNWLKNKASQCNSVLTGSTVIKEGTHYFNRLFWVNPNGAYQTYDKRHLFRMAGEHEHYAPGKTSVITQVKGWRCCPLICYDLRFPVWSRNIQKNDLGFLEPAFDVLIYVANWPHKRAHAWKSLLVARAIENQCFVVGVNRIGQDGNGHQYSGDSVVIDPWGAVISNIIAGSSAVETVELQKSLLDEARKSFPAYRDADWFSLYGAKN